MGWQAPNYVYMNAPPPPNYVKEFVDGADKTMKMVGTGLQTAKAAKEMGDKASFDNEISKITTEADTKLEALKAPVAAQVPGAPAPVAGAPAPQIGADKAVAMAGGPPVAPAAPEPAENKMKRIEINADMHDKMIKAYYKHGKVEEAQAMESKYMDQTIKLAGIDYKAASKVWNSSFLKDRYGEVDLTPKPKWKVIQGRDGNPNAVYDENSAQKPILENKDQFITMKEGETRVLIQPDGKGGFTAVEVAKGASKTPTGDNIRKFNENGKEVTEELVDGKWVRKASSPQWKEGDSVKDSKAAQKYLDDWFIQKYGDPTAAADSGGKYDKNQVLMQSGKKAVEGKLIDGKPVPLQELHDAMQAHFESKIADGAKPAEALNGTLQFGQQYGSTKKETDFSKLTPAQYEQAGVKKEIVSEITKKITEYKKKGVNLKDVRINEKAGWIDYVPDKGEPERILLAKSTAKPAAKPAPKTEPVKQPVQSAPAKPAAKKEVPLKKRPMTDAERWAGAGKRATELVKSAKDAVVETYNATPRAKMESKIKMLKQAGMTQEEAEDAAKRLIKKERES